MARGTNQATKHKSMSYTKFGYIFIAPFIIAYCLFSLYPLLTTFWYTTSNMTTITANFWGFSNKEVYYDQYLDLTTYYSDNFEEKVGTTTQEYMKIRNFFSAQEAADKNDPLNEDGMRALINNTDLSQSTRDQLQQALDNMDMSYLSAEALSELTTWRSGYKDLELTVISGLNSVNNKLTSITASTSSDEESTEETVEITAEDIITSEDYAAFIETLSAAEFDEGQQLLINYLTEKSGVESLVEYFQDPDVSIEEPAFYFIISNLNSPKATDANGESINAIPVPFIGDVETYLTKNSWPSAVTALNSYSNLEGYISRDIDLHSNQEDLYNDLCALYDMGLINSSVPLEADGDTLVQVSEENSNVIYALRQFIDTNYQADETKIASSQHIGKMTNYTSNQGRAILIGQGIEIDKYISFSGEIDVKKYKEFKDLVGMSDILTMAKYNELDADFKAAKRDAAQADYDELQPSLAPAEEAYNAAVASGDEAAIKEANEEYSTIRNNLRRLQQNIKNPKGLLTNVDASQKYISVGFENFANIFKSKTRRDTVIGAFCTTAIMWIIGFVPQILLALLLSAWFTDTKLKLKGLSLMKALMYLPNVITAATIAVFFRRLFTYSTGGAFSASQIVLRALGDEDGYNFFASGWATRLIVCFINFWMWYGNTMIVLIAGITSISESLYESAQIDGANSFQTYTKITLPLLRPIVLYTLVTSLIGGLQMFDIPQNINNNPATMNFNGTLIRSIRTVIMYVNVQAFGSQEKNQVGIASAVSVLLFIVTSILSIIIFYIMRDRDAAKAAKEKRRIRKVGYTR